MNSYLMSLKFFLAAYLISASINAMEESLPKYDQRSSPGLSCDRASIMLNFMMEHRFSKADLMGMLKDLGSPVLENGNSSGYEKRCRNAPRSENSPKNLLAFDQLAGVAEDGDSPGDKKRSRGARRNESSPKKLFAFDQLAFVADDDRDEIPVRPAKRIKPDYQGEEEEEEDEQVDSKENGEEEKEIDEARVDDKAFEGVGARALVLSNKARRSGPAIPPRDATCVVPKVPAKGTGQFFVSPAKEVPNAKKPKRGKRKNKGDMDLPRNIVYGFFAEVEQDEHSIPMEDKIDFSSLTIGGPSDNDAILAFELALAGLIIKYPSLVSSNLYVGESVNPLTKRGPAHAKDIEDPTLANSNKVKSVNLYRENGYNVRGSSFAYNIPPHLLKVMEIIAADMFHAQVFGGSAQVGDKKAAAIVKMYRIWFDKMIADEGVHSKNRIAFRNVIEMRKTIGSAFVKAKTSALSENI